MGYTTAVRVQTVSTLVEATAVFARKDMRALNVQVSHLVGSRSYINDQWSLYSSFHLELPR